MSTHDSHGADDHGHGHGGHGDAPVAPSGPPTDWGTVRNVGAIVVVVVVVALLFGLVSCRGWFGGRDVQVVSVEGVTVDQHAKEFLATYEKEFQRLQTEAQEADWLVNTHIVAGDDSNAKRDDAAKAALAAYIGSEEVIRECRHLLQFRKELTPLQVRELEMVLYNAGDKPATAKELVAQRIAAETRQTEKLFGYTFHLGKDEVTPNDLDKILKEEKDLAKRQAAWEASKEVGRGLKDGLADLQRLRNGTVRALGYSDFFSYMVSAYGMTTDEMVELNERTLRELRPLYRELHTYWRYELAKRYGQPVPDMIPAHWLPNRWSQDWNELMSVKGVDLNDALKDRQPEWLVKQAEQFYVSLGFQPLPATFWQKSSLYPVAADAGYKKNTHASAWHVDLDHDVRSLMSVEPNREWYETTHHELGHIYYYLSYSRPEVPFVLRTGANPAFHEGIGTMIGLAAMQPRFLATVGLTPDAATKPDPIQMLHQQALFYLVFAPWSSGVMMNFERDLYAKELPKDQWNKRWWELVAKYQGVVPPTSRGEEFCDAATKTHINDTPAMYYTYALSHLILMQIHEHIAKEILHEDPHDTNYFGRKDVGDFLRSLLEPGATVDWRKLMREKLGSEISAEPMLRYFAPLQKWLEEQNRGRKQTLPDV
jgi:peptidyl-dipeptidase A